MNINEFRELVGNKIFTVSFRKKDGSIRILNGRLGVKKYVKNSKPLITTKRNSSLNQSNMIGCFDLKENNYRTINLDTLINVKIKGKLYE